MMYLRTEDPMAASKDLRTLIAGSPAMVRAAKYD